MTPKEQYEARKAERKRIAEDMKLGYQVRENIETGAMLDMLDRFVTAAERIADAMERPQVTASNLTFDQNSASGFRVANTFADAFMVAK